jgi:DNA-binding transcriptional ArsR family regulator
MRAMGFFKKLFGLEKDEPETDAPPPAPAERSTAKRDARDRPDRPPLKDLPPQQTQSVEDALLLREQGDKRGARKLLEEIDKGRGLRVVLRAAAALEAGDEADVRELTKAIEAESEGWRLALQVAGALSDKARAARFSEHAKTAGAPAWALAWARATSADPDTRRAGLVDLLYEDPPLARTVAARDLNVGAITADAEASGRYAGFAHGRDSIRRFGADAVATLLERVGGLR